MSTGTSAGSAGIPPINQALEPAWVRHGSPSTQKAYAAALSFEETLVEQLARSLAATSDVADEPGSGEGEGEGEGGGPGAGEGAPGAIGARAGQLSSLLPQALSAGVMKAGGLGLAAELTRDLQGPRHTPAAGTSGGTVAAPDGNASA